MQKSKMTIWFIILYEAYRSDFIYAICALLFLLPASDLYKFAKIYLANLFSDS